MGALKPTVVVAASAAAGGTTTAGGREEDDEALLLCPCEHEANCAGAGPRVNDRAENEDAARGVAVALVRRAGAPMDTGGVVASDDMCD